MYDKVMNKFRWGFYNKPGIYLDENKTRMASNLRNNLSRLAIAFIEESYQTNDTVLAIDKLNKAVAVLDKIQYELPDDIIPHNYFSLFLANGYYLADQPEKADDILVKFADENMKELNFYLSLSEPRMMAVLSDIQRNLAIYSEILKTAKGFDRTELTDKLDAEYNQLLEKAEFAFYK
jgi:hypothetical protein